MSENTISVHTEMLRLGLRCLSEMMEVLDDWALAAKITGTRRILYDMRAETWKIMQNMELLGTPFANTNSNSKEQRSSRITNSSSKEGDSQPDSREEPGKSGDSSTNTKFEEQAP